MKIEIDKYGKLSLERAGRLKDQYCPHDPAMTNSCGDWCPLFSEPRDSKLMEDCHVSINLCRKTVRCKKKDFTDRRVNNAVS